jgi:hypothetical protein
MAGVVIGAVFLKLAGAGWHVVFSLVGVGCFAAMLEATLRG